MKPVPVVGNMSLELERVAFTPKGGCPLKPARMMPLSVCGFALVAFTPKGGCPLKLGCQPALFERGVFSSIHPQGWVPIETLPRLVWNCSMCYL